MKNPYTKKRRKGLIYENVRKIMENLGNALVVGEGPQPYLKSPAGKGL